MLQVIIDESKVEELYREAVAKKLEQIENTTVFWDVEELKRQTKMSWNTIQDRFFYDPSFPKFRDSDNGKWRFPAKECTKFLEEWWKSNKRKE